MKQAEMLKKQEILDHLIALPQKVLSLHGIDQTPAFVLHDLCSTGCFDLKKAAYLVDNPDFDCFKGITGFSKEESFDEIIWETPELFIKHMEDSPFNQKVRTINEVSPRRAGKTDHESIVRMSNYLGLNQPLFCTWKMKHDNHGILLYEAQNGFDVSDTLNKGACLLGFCPIY